MRADHPVVWAASWMVSASTSATLPRSCQGSASETLPPGGRSPPSESVQPRALAVHRGGQAFERLDLAAHGARDAARHEPRKPARRERQREAHPGGAVDGLELVAALGAHGPGRAAEADRARRGELRD